MSHKREVNLNSSVGIFELNQKILRQPNRMLCIPQIIYNLSALQTFPIYE